MSVSQKTLAVRRLLALAAATILAGASVLVAFLS
jgi:hypothetical protein